MKEVEVEVEVEVEFGLVLEVEPAQHNVLCSTFDLILQISRHDRTMNYEH